MIDLTESSRVFLRRENLVVPRDSFTMVSSVASARAAPAPACNLSGLGAWQQSQRLKQCNCSFLPFEQSVQLRIHPGRVSQCSRGRRGDGVVCSAGASGAEFGESQPIFPRIGVRDPYKRLGIGREASLEEAQEARHYLMSQYQGHPDSERSIEAAYDKIFMEGLKQRKKTKPSQAKKLVEPPAWMRTLSNRIEVPSQKKIVYRAGLYALLAIWTVFDKGQRGPAFQVLLSFVACIYFLNDRIKKLWKAALLGFAVLVVAWLVSTLLWPILPAQILPRSWGIELVSSLISYVFLFCGSTYLK